MPSRLFGLVFACCLRSSTPRHEPNETTPLLPNGVTGPTPGLRVPKESDRQRVKERLGNIVRSKEGKMVNVTDHLPFNLHNRSAPTASTSRLRTQSPSPHPSVGTGETITSQSGSSIRPHGGRFGAFKEPALSVRLVKGRDGSHRGVSSRGRLGRYGEERGMNSVRNEATTEVGDSCGLTEVPTVHISDQDAVAPEIRPLEDADRDHILAISKEIGKQLQDGWAIQDAGPISRGWGD